MIFRSVYVHVTVISSGGDAQSHFNFSDPKERWKKKKSYRAATPLKRDASP